MRKVVGTLILGLNRLKVGGYYAWNVLMLLLAISPALLVYMVMLGSATIDLRYKNRFPIAQIPGWSEVTELTFVPIGFFHAMIIEIRK